MTQTIQDERDLSKEFLGQSPERILGARRCIIGNGVDNLEVAVAAGHAAEENIVEQPTPTATEETRPAQAYAPISTDAVMEARRNLARIHGDTNA